MGVPSVQCLSFVRKLQQKTHYIGDIDPIGIYVYLAFKHLKRRPKPTDKPKLNVSWLGLTAKDYKKYVEPKDATLKLSNEEVIVSNYIKQFKLSELKDELKFLKTRKKKVEIESLSLVGFKQYIINKIHL